MDRKNFNISVNGSEWEFVDVPANLIAFPTIVNDILPVALSQTDLTVAPKKQRVIFLKTVARNNIGHGCVFTSVGLTTKHKETDIVVKDPEPHLGTRKSIAAIHTVLHEHFEKEYWYKNPNEKQANPWDEDYDRKAHEEYANQKASQVMDTAFNATQTVQGLEIDSKYFDHNI